MGILAKAFGLELLEDQPVGDYSSDVNPPARPAAGAVSLDTVVTMPAVYRAIQILAGMGANIVRDGLNSWRAGQIVDPAPAIVRQPDPWRSRRSWAARFIVNAATDGNNFVLKTRVDGVNAAAELLNPYATFIRWEKGVKYYDTVIHRRDGQLVTKTYTNADIDHVWCGLELPGHDRALGPIAACRAALAGHLDVRNYSSGWFENTDVPSGVLTSDQRLDPTTAAEYKDMWLNPKDKAGNRIYGPTVRVLGSGLSYAPVMLKPSEAQFLELLGFGVTDVARMFGIPPSKLAASVEGTSLTYETTQSIDRQLLNDTVFPVYVAPLEDALTALVPRGQEVRVTADELLRPDPKTQAEVDQIYLNAGVISREEVRTRQRWAGPPPALPAPTKTQETPA